MSLSVSHPVGHPEDQNGHIHRWDVAGDLVDHTWQNPNRIPAAQGSIVSVPAVRARRM
jgi:hypothetical protein